MTNNNTYPRRVLAWDRSGDHHQGLWQREDGRITDTRHPVAYDRREDGWVVDTRVDLPQEPPEPEPEPGWYLARSLPYTFLGVMYLDSNGRWYYPKGEPTSDDWQIVAPLTLEQVDAIDKEWS